MAVSKAKTKQTLRKGAKPANAKGRGMASTAQSPHDERIQELRNTWADAS